MNSSSVPVSHDNVTFGKQDQYHQPIAWQLIGIQPRFICDVYLCSIMSPVNIPVAK